MKSKFLTLKGGSRKGHTVFTEQGIAKFYQDATRRMNEVIKRDINRFPNSVCFQLTSEEIDELSSRSQIVTLNKGKRVWPKF